MTTTPTIRDALDVLAAELRLAAILLILPTLFDLIVLAACWRVGIWPGIAACWAHPATRLVDRFDLRGGARP